MLKNNSAKAIFQRAQERGCENNKDSINEEEVKKKLKPSTKSNYHQTLALSYDISKYESRTRVGKLTSLLFWLAWKRGGSTGWLRR
jgi:hypothetical protein